jgi:hypothetical protein
VERKCAVGLVVLWRSTLTGQDPDAGTAFSYSLVNGADGRLTISGDGQLYVAGIIDFEVTPSMSLTVRVADQGGLSFTNTFVIPVANVNERPTSLTLSNVNVNVRHKPCSCVSFEGSEC